MEERRVRARVELTCGVGAPVAADALFDTGAYRSVVSEDLVAGLAGCRLRLPRSMRYEMAGVVRGSTLRVEEVVVARVRLAQCEVQPTVFEVSPDLDPGTVIVGRPELDAWGIDFTPSGPAPRACPPKMGII